MLCLIYDVCVLNLWWLFEICVNRIVLYVDYCVVVVVVVIFFFVWFDVIVWLCFNCWFKLMFIYLNVFIIYVFKK